MMTLFNDFDASKWVTRLKRTQIPQEKKLKCWKKKLKMKDNRCCFKNLIANLQVYCNLPDIAKNAQIATSLFTSCNNLLQQADIRMRL